VHLGNPVGGEAAHFGVLEHGCFVRGDVNAIDLVAGNITVDPLDLGTQFTQDTAGFLRDGFQGSGDILPASGISRSMTNLGNSLASWEFGYPAMMQWRGWQRQHSILLNVTSSGA
jgi:hypothetical protein